MAIDWKETLRAVAPGLATIAGGPLWGAAVKMIGDKVLGNGDATEAEVIDVLSRGSLTAEQMVQLKQVESNLQVELAQIDAAREAAYIADTGAARRATVDLASAKSPIAWGAPIISTIVVLGFIYSVSMLFGGDDIPANRFQLLLVMFGVLSSAMTQVVNYWLGSSAGSARAGDAVRKIAQAKTERPS